MSVIKEILKKEILEPALNNRAHDTVGFITRYNPATNKASAQFHNPNNGTKMFAHGISISMPPNGFHPVEPKAGDKCLISFEHGDIAYPRIVMIYDENYGRIDGPYDKLKTEYSSTVPDILGYI